MAKLQQFFSKNIEAALKDKDMSQRQLAKLADVDETGLGRWLKGKTAPGLEQVERMAAALDVPVFYLFMTPEDRARWNASKDASLDQRLHESLRRLNRHQKEALLLAMAAMISDSGNRDNS